MEYFLKLINDFPWLNIVFIFLALIGMFITIWLYFKGKIQRKPTYYSLTKNIIKDSNTEIKSLEFFNEYEKINNLSITKLSFWNAGKETICSTDVAPREQLRIEINSNYDILDCELTYQKNIANGFIIKKIDNKVISITFDYFDFNEGVIIDIYHTAPNGPYLKLKGSIKGTKIFQKVVMDIRETVKYMIKFTFSSLSIYALILVLF